MPLADALQLVEDAAARLWTPEGADALDYLQGRGLTEATIRAARLGWTPGRAIPDRGRGRDSGESLASSSPGSMATAWRWSRSAARGEEAEVRRSVPRPARRSFRPPRSFDLASRWSIAEGEFDALLLGQALGDLAAVVTLGSASSKPEASILSGDAGRRPVVLATDADDAGDKAASGWPARAIRVRPPAPYKDWTEAADAGVNLPRWWTDRLGGIEAPALSTWDELARQAMGTGRWRPDPRHHHRPARPRPDAGRLEAAALDPYAIEERSAIQGEGCP